MSTTTTAELAKRKNRIRNRLAPRNFPPRPDPVFAAANIHYEIAGRTRGMAAGGIGAIHLMARRIGLIDALDRDLALLKVHKPYHESDHVLNIAYNLLAGGTCLEDLELRRNDEVYLDALGACRIPDPTTAGDFCRRFDQESIQQLMRTLNRIRLKVWKQQPAEFFQQAIIEADGTMAPTTGECKGGMNIGYNGIWGYHPLVVSLANTKEPLFLMNRPANRPSHEGADAYFDQAIGLCTEAGFKSILLRGDTDFTQTWKLDAWHGQGVQFLFGIDAFKSLIARANALPEDAWTAFPRPAKYTLATEPRTRPENVKEQVVREKGFNNIRLAAVSDAGVPQRVGVLAGGPVHPVAQAVLAVVVRPHDALHLVAHAKRHVVIQGNVGGAKDGVLPAVAADPVALGGPVLAQADRFAFAQFPVPLAKRGEQTPGFIVGERPGGKGKQVRSSAFRRLRAKPPKGGTTNEAITIAAQRRTRSSYRRTTPYL